MNRVLAFLFLVAIADSAMAISGESSTGSRGGGDPQVAEFCEVLDSSYRALAGYELFPRGVSLSQVDSLVNDLCLKLDSPLTTTVSFVNHKIFDESGAEKLAYFSKRPLKILVNRTAWMKLGRVDKQTLAALELLGLSGVPDRYAISGRLKARLEADDQPVRPDGSHWTFDHVVIASGVVTYFKPIFWATAEVGRPLAMTETSLANDRRRYGDAICRELGNLKSSGLLVSDARAQIPRAIFFDLALHELVDRTFRDQCRAIESISCVLQRQAAGGF